MVASSFYYLCLDINQSTIGLRLKDVGSSSHHVGSSPRGLLCYVAVLRWFRTSDVGIAAFSNEWIYQHDRPCSTGPVQGGRDGFVPHLL